MLKSILKYLYQTQLCFIKAKGRNYRLKQASTLGGKIKQHKDQNPGSMVLGPHDQSQQEKVRLVAVTWTWKFFFLGPFHTAYILSVTKTKSGQRSENCS